ncbi:MAG: hypothetical protein QM770_12495 [Tepidisphaeraceae bacterium]
MTAARKLTELRGEFGKDVRDSIELADLRRSMNEALVRRLSSEAYYESALNIAASALDYATYSRRQDRLTPNLVDNYGNYYGNGGYYFPTSTTNTGGIIRVP